MNIGFISTRLAGTDGVSLETAKLATIVRRMGHDVFYCAGELDSAGPPGMLVPEMHFAHPAAKCVHDEAFIGPAGADLRERIAEQAAFLRTQIAAYVARFSIDVLFPQNALAIPMHIPLGVALRDYIAATGIPTIAHHHDFFWERKRFARCAVADIVAAAFPPDLPSIRHLVINRLAQASLKRRKGIEAHWLPNIFDYANPPVSPDVFAADLRRALNLEPENRVILQPTRVVPRKGIEMAVDLVQRLGDAHNKLLITHHAGDEGMAYLHALQTMADERRVDLRYVAAHFAPERSIGADGSKIYSLWDAYPLANFVTYPSLVEGFGNAFLEAIYFRKPLLVNRYAVYVSDLAPLGFRCVEVDGVITDVSVAETQQLLTNPSLCESVVAHNYALARKHFSYEAATPILQGALNLC